MVSRTFSEREQRFIRYLGDCFENGRLNQTRNLVREKLQLSEADYESLIRMAGELGLIDDVQCTDGYFATWFNPTFTALDLSREFDAAEEAGRQRDVFEQIKRRIKMNPVAAWIIIIFLVLGFLYQIAIDVCERLGWIAVPK